MILNYSDFVETTFAHACVHTRSLPSFQDPLLSEDQLRAIGDRYIGMVDELNLRLDRLHVGMALAGEILEFQLELEGDANISDTTAELKEVGDLCYYTQMILNLYDLPGIRLEGDWQFNDNPGYSIVTNVVEKSEVVIDLIKRFEIYRQEYNKVKLERAVCDFVYALKELAYTFYDQPRSGPLDVVIQQNVEKLKKRYPKGTFDTQDSASKRDAVLDS